MPKFNTIVETKHFKVMYDGTQYVILPIQFLTNRTAVQTLKFIDVLQEELHVLFEEFARSPEPEKE